jgi:hypothetical protein
MWRRRIHNVGLIYDVVDLGENLDDLPHLAVRVRDGSGLVGPLVIPGVTS